MTLKDPACGTGSLLSRRALLKGLPAAAGAAMLAPGASCATQSPAAHTLIEALMTAVEDLDASTAKHRAHHEYVAVISAKVERVIAAAQDLSAGSGGLASMPREATKPAMSDILTLYHRHEALCLEASTYQTGLRGEAEDRELDRLFFNEADECAAKMMSLPSQSPADFAAKLVVDSCQGDHFSDWETGVLWREARNLIATGSAGPKGYPET